MRVYVVTETLEHNTHDCADGKDIVGVYADKADAITRVNRRFTNELEGRGLNESDGWTDSHGGYLRDNDSECVIAWAIESFIVW